MAGLLDFLQSASNSAASNVSAPVDGIAWLLRRAGLDVGEPVGGSDWMQRQGLTRPVKQGAASLAGETAGLLSPMLAAAKAPQIARGLLSLDDHAMDMARQAVEKRMVSGGLLQPATVWHGSPHKFDKFDSSKIGTGEGAQAYGHGLYLAESDRVAKQYADTLTDKAPKFLDGVPAEQLSTAQKSALGMLADAGGNANAALLAAKTDMARSGGAGADFHVERYNTLRDIARGKAKAQVGEPSLYKVDLSDNAIAKMLDWDGGVVGTPANDLLKAADRGARSESTKGRDLYGRLVDQYGEREAARMLQQAGVPGIRYLDGGSRGAGSGTRNYVVFPGNESLLQILERNGQPLK